MQNINVCGVIIRLIKNTSSLINVFGGLFINVNAEQIRKKRIMKYPKTPNV